MKKRITFVLFAFLALCCICGYAQTIDPVLRQEMEQKNDDEKIKVIVIMNSQYDRQQLNRRAAHYVTRAERREFVVNELKQFTEASQYDLRSSLSEMESQDLTTSPTILWMANAMYFSATKQAINDLAMRRDIALIGLDEERYALFDEETRPASMTRDITPNVTQVNADQVWELGYTGQGVVVAVIDTGVNYNHLDLADHLWDGGAEYPYHGYDFYNNDNNPMDDHSHGTHCAGTVCGDGTAGRQTGMAPDATLMCVKVLSSGGSGSVAVTCNAMQWAVEHGCDLFSMSLGWANATITERELFRTTCVAVLDAGVVGAIAAGNEGSGNEPNNVRVPGSCPPPYMDPIQAANEGDLSCTVCVGAVDYDDYAAYFTSRGPVTWANTSFGDYPYTPGSSTAFGLIRPDVCAPGVDVISAYYGSNNGYTTMSGTSMATPCMAGCISLLLSKKSNATPEEICQVLEETAVPLATGKSNTYGYGRVDVLAAINALYSGPLTLESFTVNDSQGNNDGKLNAGESVTLNLTLTNDSDIALDGATMVLSSESDYVTITNGTANVPHFGVGQTQTINNMFGFTLSDNAPAKKNIQFLAETYVNGESVGAFRIGVMVYGHILKFVEVSVLNDNNGNGSLEAGETGNLHVTISNAGNDPASSVVGTLSTAYPYLSINSNNKSFGNLEVNEQASANYNVTLSSGAPNTYAIGLSLDLVDAAQKHTDVDFELWRKAITLTSNPVGAGTLSGGGYYGQGQTCTITATPNNGYAFVSWTLNGEEVSYFPTYSFEVVGEANYVANFQAFNNSFVVGEGTGTDPFLPSFAYYSYTLSQQIYTADEIHMGSGEISSVSFFNAGYSMTRNYAVYLVNTSKTSFDNNYDWITVSENDKVFDGSVTLNSGQWTTIYFSTPFVYDGSSNIALIMDDNTGSWYDEMSCRVFEAEGNQAMYVYSDYTNYDPYNPSGYYGTQLSVKNEIVLGTPSYDFTVSVSANPTGGGTVSGGGGLYYYGQPVTLTATPNDGYVFNNWTKNNEVVSYLSTCSVPVTESATYVANFQEVPNSIVIGDATGTNSTLPTYYYYSLSQQIYTASEMGANGQTKNISSVSFFNTGTYSVTRNMNIYMVNTEKTSFESSSDWIPVTQNDLVFSGNVNMITQGWVTIYFNTLFEYDGSSNVALIVDDNSNSYNSYTPCRVFGTDVNQAIRIYGSDTNYDPSDVSNYSGTLMSVKNQVIFGQPVYGYTVTATADPTGGGTVSGGGSCYYGQPITLTATPSDGYVFNSWTKNGEVISYLSTYNLNVTETATYVANFELVVDGFAIGDATYTNYYLPTYYYCSLTEQIYTAAEMGGVATDISNVSFFNTSNYSRTRNLSVYLAHTNQTGFESDTAWIAVSEDDLVFSGNVTLSANGWTTIFFDRLFTYDGVSNVVLVVDDNSNNYNSYTSFRTFDTDGNQAIRISGYNMDYDPTNPYDYTGTRVSVKNQVIFGIPNPQYTVTAIVTPENSGTVSGGEGLYYLGQPCTLTATANPGYGFYYWRENGTIKSYDPVYTFPVMGNMELEAYFGEPFAITVTANPTEGGTVTGGGDYGYNQQCTVTATANEGYLFSKWTKNTGSSAVACLPTYTFSVTAQATYVAQFTQMDGIAIGEPTNTNYYLPSYTYYPYSLTQQIYTADELNSEACAISSVTFFNAGYGETRNLTVYLVNTDKSSFSGSNDWIAVTEADKVFEGNFTTSYRNWSTLYFNTAFEYDGHSNLALIVDDNTNSWNGSTYCRTFDTETTQAIRICSSDTNYNPSNPNYYTGTLMSVKNQVVFGIANPQYYVSVTADPVEGGSVTGSGGPYFYGQPISITATANNGYVFNYWTRYNENYGYEEVVSYFSPDNLPVFGDVEYVAHFQQMDGLVIGEPTHSNYYLPDYSSYPYSLSQQIYTAAEMGGVSKTISSVSLFNTNYGDTRDLSIYMVNTNKTMFNSEYDWITVSDANLVYSGTVTMNSNDWTTIYFNTAFDYNGSYNLALIVVDNTGEWGSGMLCRTFETQNAQAIYALGYDYALDPSNPYDNYGDLLTQKNQVVFGSPTAYYTVTVSANPTEGGTVSGGGGSYFYGQPITLTATASEGYVFNNWTKDGVVVSGSPIFVLSVTEAGNYVANFQELEGTLIGDGTETYAYLPSYSWYCYTLSQQIYTAEELNSEECDISSISFYNTSDEAYDRNFTIYMVNTDKTSFESETDWITVSEEDQVFSGIVEWTSNSWTTIHLNSLFHYDGVSNIALIVDDNTGNYISTMYYRVSPTDSYQSIYIYSDGTNYNPYNPTDYYGYLPLVKNQIILGTGTPSYDYTVSVTINPANTGTVTGNENMFYLGQNCTLTATPNPGYMFYNWTRDGSVVSTSESYTFAVTGDMSFVANFGEPITITATANPAEGGTVSGGGNYAQGQICTLTATPNNKYVFLNWTKDGSVVSSLPTYSFTVNTEGEYVANFQRLSNGFAIGNGSSTSYNLPSYTYYPYYLSQQIYTADEIGMECDISSVAFYNTSATTQNRNFTVYLVQTDKTSFTGSYDWITATEADQVFSGNITIRSRAWTVFNFDSPFHYDGTSNLAIIVDDNTGNYGSSIPFRTYYGVGYQSIYASSYSTDLDPLNPTNSGSRTSVKNQIILGFPSSDYVVTVSSEPSEGGSVSGGGTFAYGQPCIVSATANEGYCFYNWTENGEVVSTDASYYFQVTDSRDLVANFGTAVVITASADPAEGGSVSGSGSYAPGHFCNLTATANYGYTFISWTKDGEVVSYLSSYTFVAEDDAEYVANFEPVYHGVAIGDAFGTNPDLPSNSYYNYTLSQQIYTADEIGGANEISSIAFFNAGTTKTRNFTIYLKHTDKVAFSNNIDWIPVTYADQVYYGSVTMTAGQWTYIDFDVPFAYNGTSNLVLVVDDNTGDYSYGLNCRAFVANGTQALQIVGDDLNFNPHNPSNYMGSLITLKNQVIFGFTPTIVQQTVALSAGTNWFSTYVDITLDELKAALVAASPSTSITIKSQNSGQTTWNGRLWVGTLRTMDVSQMYMISVANACEITLEGVMVNPAHHPVIINNGPNWIGFQLAESMTITNAFANFAAPGDIVKSQNRGQATWNGRLWVGQFKTLNPGEGYIYQSAASGSRTFVFPMGAK